MRAKYQPLCDAEACSEPAAIDWKDDPRNSDTWFYSECCQADCENNLCEEHADDARETCSDVFPAETKSGELTFLCEWCASSIFERAS